jgi:hypothetical protein
MSERAEQLLAAMRARHGAVVRFSRLKARINEFEELPNIPPQGVPELLEICRSLVFLLKTERELNERLSAFAMGMQEAGAISSEELNMLMGIG